MCAGGTEHAYKKKRRADRAGAGRSEDKSSSKQVPDSYSYVFFRAVHTEKKIIIIVLVT